MLIIESETGVALVPTQELKVDEKKIFYKEMSGTAREVSKEKVLAKLPATPSAEQELTREEAVAAINAYLEAKAQYPNLDEPLQRELEIWKGRIDKMPSPEDPEALARAVVLAVAPSDPIHAGGLGEAKELDHLVWLQAGLKEALPAEIRLTDEEINAWWGRRLRFLPAEVTDVFAVRTEGWQVQFVEGGMTLDRPGRWLGQTLQLRHQLIFSRSEKGEDIYRVEATLGKLPLPPVVVLKTWNQWVESLLLQAQIFPGAKDVKLERLEKGAVVFSGG